MAAEMGNSVLAEWRAYFEWKNEQQMQAEAGARVEATLDRPRRH